MASALRRNSKLASPMVSSKCLAILWRFEQFVLPHLSAGRRGPAPKLNVINAVAEFERDLLIERTQAGLNRAKAEGITLGWPPSLSDEQRRDALRRLKEGAIVSALAREFKISRQSIIRIRRLYASETPARLDPLKAQSKCLPAPGRSSMSGCSDGHLQMDRLTGS
jgi:hypothetical protein